MNNRQRWHISDSSNQISGSHLPTTHHQTLWFPQGLHHRMHSWMVESSCNKEFLHTDLRMLEASLLRQSKGPEIVKNSARLKR